MKRQFTQRPINTHLSQWLPWPLLAHTICPSETRSVYGTKSKPQTPKSTKEHRTSQPPKCALPHLVWLIVDQRLQGVRIRAHHAHIHVQNVHIGVVTHRTQTLKKKQTDVTKKHIEISGNRATSWSIYTIRFSSTNPLPLHPIIRPTWSIRLFLPLPLGPATINDSPCRLAANLLTKPPSWLNNHIPRRIEPYWM